MELDTLLKRLIFAFVILTLVLMVFVAKFASITDPNVADYAQIARHVSRGEGFVTSAISPLSLAVVPRVDRHPELVRPPLYICILAASMLIGGATDNVVALTSTLLFVATLLLTYVLARRAFNDQVATFAVLIVAFTVPLLRQAVSGAETSLLTLLVTLLWGILLWREHSEQKQSLRWPALAGVVLGLCYLTLYQTAALVVPIAFYFWRSDRSRALRSIGITAGCFIVVVSPWIVMSSMAAGRPLVSLDAYDAISFTNFWPMQSVQRTFSNVPPSPWIEALRHPLAMARKLNAGLQVLYRNTSDLAGALVLPFFLVGLFLGPTRRRLALFQWCLLLSIALLAVTVCVYIPLPWLMLSFVPIVAILAVNWFSTLVDDYLNQIRGMGSKKITGQRRYLALVAWMVILAYPLAGYLLASPAAQEHPIAEISRQLGKQEAKLIATDVPWFVAWYGGKTALLIPQSGDELSAIVARKVTVDCVYLSPSLLQMPADEGIQYWQDVLVSRSGLTGFRRDTTWRSAGDLWHVRK